ncbi:MAG TPA: SDR family oxidoreductase [Caulobacteraceae bacterium]|nr:SDR family oxidoreductase [Caulobacteraceae bacterium]
MDQSGAQAERGAALVTGAGRRIGRTIALTLAAAGFDILVHHHRSAEDAGAVCEAVRALGRRARVVSADLGDETETLALVAAGADLGPITALVNNASVFEDDALPTLTPDSWRRHMDINLRAPVLLSQAFAAALPDGQSGAIVNMLDQRVLRPSPHFFSYSLSKAALWSATRTLAQALAPRIRVNGVGPGPTLASVHQSPADFAAEAGAVPLGRGATPAEIAAAVLYLIDAPSVTGQMIAVDGGQHLDWRTPDLIDPA